jgi:hypothetical protein
MNATVPEFATAPDFIRVGLTYRQVSWWTTRGWLKPNPRPKTGSGHINIYPDTELRIAELMVQLIDAGIEPEAAAHIARYRAEGAAALRRLADLVEAA